MKRALFGLILVLLLINSAESQYPIVPVRDIQFVPQDSLILADSLAAQGNVSHWTLQASPRIRHGPPYNGDTLTVVALCVVPGKVLTFTQHGYTMLLYDTTSNPYPWGSLFVRCSADTATHIADGFLNVRRGDVIAMTGVVSEFPTNSYHSVTQFQPIPGIPIIPLATGRPIPPAVRLPVSIFYTGIFPAGRVHIATGEQYEALIVEITNTTLDVKVNTGRGTFSFVDSSNNQLTDYDASRYYTLKGTSIDHPFPDSVWSIVYPALNTGTRIDTIRGFTTTVSGSENPRGYRIAPIYRRPIQPRDDVVFGIVLPSVSQHRRNPVVVPSDSAAHVSVRVQRQTGGFGIASVSLFYSLNNGPFQLAPMTLSDTTYKADIPLQPENTFVHYFMKAVDSLGNSVILASSASGGAARDTSLGFFFYTVLNRPLTIFDLQYTPYTNGRSAYIGASNVPIKGIVTADTAHIGIVPLTTGGTSAWYMQSGIQPGWNGLWVVGTESTMAGLSNGDSITVTGTVAEEFDVTRLQNITTTPVVHATGLPQPTPVVLSTGTFGPSVGNGTPSAEQWEGMLVRFNNVEVTDTTFWTFADRTEYAVNDGSGPVLVRRDGRNNYSNNPADTVLGRIILRPGNQISFLQGIMYFSFNRYKIVPRTNADFGTVTSVERGNESVLPDRFSLEQNYPNPFNPTTTIRYSVPQASYVVLKVYNLLGQEVATLVNESQSAGVYAVRFDGSRLASGLHFYRLQAGNYISTRKMLLIK